MEYRLIAAGQSDNDWLETLRRAVYQDVFVSTWGRWDEARHQRHFAACLERGGISIIEVEGVRVGMVQLFEQPDAVEVGEIQVLPDRQGRGIGACVLLDILADARQRLKPVRLRVGLKNARALALYTRLGFREEERTETHHHLVYPVPA